MLNEQEIREISARSIRVILSTLICSIGVMGLYCIGMFYFVESSIALSIRRLDELPRAFIAIALMIALMLLVFATVFVPLNLAIRYVGRFKTTCPSCHKDISSRINRILSTRCCPECSERVFEGGRTHSAAVYKRYQTIKSRHFLIYWLWAWPILGGLVVTWQFFDRSAFEQCSRVLWYTPLIGAATAGWAWLRTSDRRYVPQLLVSVVLLGFGTALFWHAL